MFLLSQNDENQSENGSKNSKIRLRARPPAEPQKKMLQTKELRSKSWKTRVFFTFRLPILDGRVHEQASSVLFFTVFFEGERHDLSKTGGFGRKMPPPPGKPVTFYECHPDDNAPAPSVRADFSFLDTISTGIQWPLFQTEDLRQLRRIPELQNSMNFSSKIVGRPGDDFPMDFPTTIGLSENGVSP